jgi:hypothetical protein
VPSRADLCGPFIPSAGKFFLSRTVILVRDKIKSYCGARERPLWGLRAAGDRPRIRRPGRRNVEADKNLEDFFVRWRPAHRESGE